MLTYNLGNLWRRLVLLRRIESWSLTSVQQRLVKTGGRLVQARALLLALPGGESPDQALIRVDAPADLGTARADGLTQDPLAEGIWRSNEARADRCLGDALKWRGARLSSRLEVFPWADFEGAGMRRNNFSLRGVPGCRVTLATVGQNGNPSLPEVQHVKCI